MILGKNELVDHKDDRVVTNHNEKWDVRFLELAEFVSKWSKDPSTKVGAIITSGKYIVSIGYNGLPKNIDHEDEILEDRELKYDCVIHGELNALLHAKRSIQGCTLYTYPFPPCSKCASIFIEAGIARVVAPSDQIPDKWRENIKLAEKMLTAAGVILIGVSDYK